MRVSFEWIDEDGTFPDNRCQVSLAGDDRFINKRSLIGKMMASVIRMMELDNDPRGNTIFFRTVTEKESKALDDLLEDMREDEWKE